VGEAIRQARPLLRQQEKYAAERAEIEAISRDRGARMHQGAELLCKTLILRVGAEGAQLLADRLVEAGQLLLTSAAPCR
jgi:hypothetical protein